MKNSFSLLFQIIIFSVFFNSTLFAATLIVDVEHLPEIGELSAKNVLFRQFCEDIENNSILSAKNELPSLHFYKYKITEPTTLFLLSSRLSLRYETLATLNHLDSLELENITIIIPDFNGLFISEKSELSYEIILKQNISSKNYEKIKLKVKNPHAISPASSGSTSKEEIFDFYLNAKFDPTERQYFVDSGMKLPVEQHVISSSFGYRTSPISGKFLFHKGIDLACPEGTNVFACKNGKVFKTGYDNVYGNYIIINHDGNKKSLYAHLSKIETEKGKIVQGGQKIGKAGTTGASTGPHLHFEFYSNDKPQNPEELIKF